MEKFYNIKLLALTAVMAAAMTACSDSEPAAVGENAEANVVVTIKAAPSAPQSRSNDPWQGTQPEEEGKIDNAQSDWGWHTPICGKTSGER